MYISTHDINLEVGDEIITSQKGSGRYLEISPFTGTIMGIIPVTHFPFTKFRLRLKTETEYEHWYLNPNVKIHRITSLINSMKEI